MKNTKNKLQNLFLSFWNDYLTIDLFAEHHEMSYKRAKRLLILGKTIHEQRTGEPV